MYVSLFRFSKNNNISICKKKKSIQSLDTEENLLGSDYDDDTDDFKDC